MTFKPKQLDPKAARVFTGSEVGTLLESIDEKLDVLVEGQKTLDSRLKRVETKVEVLTDTVGDIKVDLTEVKATLDRKADRVVVQQLDRRVAALEAK